MTPGAWQLAATGVGIVYGWWGGLMVALGDMTWGGFAVGLVVLVVLLIVIGRVVVRRDDQ